MNIIDQVICPFEVIHGYAEGLGVERESSVCRAQPAVCDPLIETPISDSSWLFTAWRGSFRVGHDIDEVVRITDDGEVKAPPAIHAGLPDVAGLVVFFGS